MNNTKENSSILLKSSSKNSLAVKNFGTKVFNELVISSWMQTKKIESVSQAWAFVKLCEMIAGRLLTELLPGETAEFKVENVSTIYLEVFPPDTNR